MAVLAEYTSGNESYAKSANAFISGMKDGQSLMERKQAMQIQAEQNQRARFEFEAKKPVIIANAIADTESAQASIENATRQEMLRAQAAKESTSYNDEFLAAMRWDSRNDVPASYGTPKGDAAQKAQAEYATQDTLTTRSRKLAELKSKIGWMSLIPEYKGFVDTVNVEANKAHLEAAGNAKLTELMNAAEFRANAAKYNADQGVVKESIKANAKVTAAEGYQTSRERIAALQSDTKLTLQERAAKIAEEKQGATISDLSGRAAEADQQAADASANGDEQAAHVHRQVAAAYRDAIQKNSNYAGQAPTPVPVQPPVPRPKIKANATSVDIGGKIYPVYRDKNDKRAYLINGKYVPIETE